MTQKQKIELIALYDGWEKYDSIRRPVWYSKGSFRVDGFDIEHFGKYLTSLDWLHPVAMKVMDEILVFANDFFDKANCDLLRLCLQKHSSIGYACLQPCQNGQYLELFDAVVEEILFINQQKQKENDSPRAN